MDLSTPSNVGRVLGPTPPPNKADISTETVGDNQGLVKGDFTGELSCLHMSGVSRELRQSDQSDR